MSDTNNYLAGIKAILGYLRQRLKKRGFTPDMNDVSTSKWTKRGKSWEKSIYVEDAGIGTIRCLPLGPGYRRGVKFFCELRYPLSYEGPDGRAMVAGEGHVGFGHFKNRANAEKHAVSWVKRALPSR